MVSVWFQQGFQQLDMIHNFSTSDFQMPPRSSWSSKEDELLRELREDKKMKRWSDISKLIRANIPYSTKTGKQCRDRFLNHLDSNISTTEWSMEEETALNHLHNEYGNKWALIANRLPGRSENAVKNRFYAILRKSLRRINKASNELFKIVNNGINESFLSRVIEISENRFEANSKIDDRLVEICLEIKNKLFIYDGSARISFYNTEEVAKVSQMYQTLQYVQQKCAKVRLAPKKMPAIRHERSKVGVQEMKTDHQISTKDVEFFNVFNKICGDMMLETIE